jgi:hypothetical protein
MLLYGPAALHAQGVDGRLHYPLREASGRALILVFITRECPVCNEYAPEIERIYRTYRSKAMIALVFSDRYVTASTAKTHAGEFGLKGPALFLDPVGKLATACNVGVTPEAAVFSPGGKETYTGRIDDLFYSYGSHRDRATTHDLRRAIDATLAGDSVPKASGPPVGCAIETQ